MQGVQVVVTGAGGFIGRWLVRELVHQGAQVTAMVHRAPSAGIFPPEVAVERGDITRAGSLGPIFAGKEILIHAAGLYRFGLGHRRALELTNALGTSNILAAARKAGMGRIIHLSSAGILKRENGLIEADDFPAYRPRWSAYKGSKWEAELVVMAAARDGLPVRIASIPCPLGSEDHTPTPTGRMVQDYVEGRFPFSTRTGLNFIGIRDLARGIIAVADKGENGRRYLLGQENITLSDFLQRLDQEVGESVRRKEIPWPLIAMGGIFGECAHLWRPHEGRRLCLETALQARRYQFFEVTATQKALGWSPEEPLNVSLRESLDWFRRRSAGPLALPSTPPIEPHVA